jgi:type I restriction enzyme S subunit
MTFPQVPLSEFTTPVARPIVVEPGKQYRTIGVKWWGEGAYERETIDGAQTAAKSLSVVKTGDLIINKIWVRHGSAALASEAVDGCAASGEFPTFTLNPARVIPRWMHWLTKTRGFWHECEQLSQGTSGKNRIKPELFQTIKIPLPAVEEQRRIVARVDAIASRVAEARATQAESERDIDRLLMAVYQKITKDAPRKPLREVAPLTRRPVGVEPTASYPQLSARSFGKGTFHQPTLHGADITWEKPFQVRGGDILISNIKAWEGAIAVVRPEDDGRFSSHRYLTCVPVPNVATARFVCFHLLTPEGLHHVGEASPGSADRNRTTNSKQLMEIPVPLPPHAEQLRFDALQAKLDAVRAEQAATAAELDALLPSVLNRAFAGEL